ncbi:MAG: hypothetical protein K5799_12530 [Erythrobacter sp.]|nr:hypothetical protein [Erythrobacter sp.]
MTLQNGCVTGSTAYLWADTAVFHGETGDCIGFDTKVFELLNFPAAGTLSCHGGNPHEIALAIGRALPFNVSSLLSAAVEALRAYCSAGGGGRVLLASNIGGPALHMVASDQIWPGYAPFEPVELQSYTSSGNQTPAYVAAVQNGFTPESMARVIDAQIAEPSEGAGKLALLGPRVWIGGNIVQYAVSSNGVESRVLRNVDSEAA